MYELVVIACLIGQPAKCEQFYVPLEPSTSMMQCMHEGQLRLASWIGERPEWVIRRWTCGLPRA